VSIAPADYVKAGLRYLQLDEATQAEMKASTKPQIFEKVEAEAAAVQWVLAAALIWNEQGVLDDVLAYLREQATGQASLEVAV
jgi:hypothetical protein